MSRSSLARRETGVSCHLALLLMALLLGPRTAVPQTATARGIMERIYQQDDSRDTTLRATLQVFGQHGAIERKRFVLYRMGSPGDSKTLLRFTDPPEIRGVALLSVNRRGENDRQWLYVPAIQRVRRVAPRERSEPFAGSDFSYEDVAERVLDDFTYRFLSEVDTIDGHKTFKIEATPIASDRSQYEFVYYWVAKDLPVILHAEMYDQQGQLLRRFHASQLKKVSGIWGARRVEISSVRENTRTTLTIDAIHFNTGLDEEQFTPQALERVVPPPPARAPHH